MTNRVKSSIFRIMGKPNQRQKDRISMFAAAVVRNSPSSPPVEAYIVNISYGGLGMYVKKPLQGRVQTALNLSIGKSKRVTETIWGQVTWVKPVGTSYAVGISFEGLNPKDHGVLLSFLETWHPVEHSESTLTQTEPETKSND